MASEARSPSIWLCLLTLMISLAVAEGTFALESAALTSASDMNGTPLASSVFAFETTLDGTLGLFSMPVKNAAVIAEMSTAPARAVPIDAPSWVPVFWSPPTSPLFSIRLR